MMVLKKKDGKWKKYLMFDKGIGLFLRIEKNLIIYLLKNQYESQEYNHTYKLG
jgi:hypothetical protein